MSKLELLKETSSLIRKDLFNDDDYRDENMDYQKLKSILTDKVTELLKNNIGELLRILYRIDVAEQKVKNAFKCLSEEEIAEHIATLIIERQMQKVEIRRKYSSDQ